MTAAEVRLLLKLVAPRRRIIVIGWNNGDGAPGTLARFAARSRGDLPALTPCLCLTGYWLRSAASQPHRTKLTSQIPASSRWADGGKG